MPNLDSNLTTLRAGGWREWYLAAFAGTSVLTGAVTADASDQATSISYTTSTGSSANVKRGYLVRVTTSAGALKGFWRVRASGTLSSTALPITELSAGSVDIHSGDLIEVRNVILPGAKVTEADENFRPDGLAAGTNNSAIPPMACAGPHDMGFVDSGQSYRTVTFPGSLSYAVDADSGGALTYSWTAATATGATSSASAGPTFTFPVGEHLVTLTVTDSSNSATWTTYRKVVVFDDDNPPYEVIIESIDSDIESGTSARFRIVENGSLDDLPDGTLVGLFARELINGTEQSFGNSVGGRSHIKALGYLRRESNRNTAEDGAQELAFEIVSPLVFYKELVTGYSKVMQHNASADAWGELDDLSVKRGIIQIGRWYTWLTEFHDLTFHSTFDDRDYSAFFIQKQSPIDQLLELADGVDARITSDRTGSLSVQMRPECIAEGSRSGITTWGTFTDGDRGDYSFEREHWRPIEMVEGRAFTDGTSTSNNQPIFSRWPGLAPGAGATNTIVERLIADDQTDLNTRIGRRAAWEDGVYFTSTGVLHRAIQGEVTFPGSYLVFDPAYCEYLLLDFDGATNLRGIDLGDHRFIIQRVGFTPDEQGSGEVAVSFRTATNSGAAPGVTYTPPSEDDNGLPPYTPPDVSIPPFPVSPFLPNPYGLTPGAGTMFFVDENSDIYRTNQFTNPQDWTRQASGASGTAQQFVVDAFSPGYPGGGSVAGGAVRGILVTDEEAATIDTMNGTPSVLATDAHRRTDGLHSIDSSFGAKHRVLLASAYPDGTYRRYSSDFETWSAEDAYGSGGLAWEDCESVETLVATLTPSGLNGTYHFTGLTTPGTAYRVTISGTYRYGTAGGTHMADYFYRENSPGGSWSLIPFGGFFSGFAVDPAIPSFSATHQYSFTHIGDGNSWGFATRDDIRNDNTAGDIVVRLYRVDEPCDEVSVIALSFPSAWVASGSIGEALTSGPISSGAAASGFYTDDNGATLSSAVPPDIDPGDELASEIHRPHPVDVAAAVGPTYHGNVSGGARHLYRVNADNSVDDVSPSYAGETYGPWLSRWQIVSNPSNRLHMAVCLTNADKTLAGVWTTTDGGDTWTLLVTPTTLSATYWRVAILDNDDLILFGAAGMIGYAPNLGANPSNPGVQDRRGLLLALFPDVTAFIGVFGPGA